MIRYRRFETADAEGCRSLILSCVDDLEGLAPGACEKLRLRIGSSPYARDLAGMYCIVAESSGSIVGMGALDNGAVKRMYVSPDHRRRGVGRKIHGMLEQEAGRKGLETLELEASMNSVDFYAKLGYRPVSEHVWSLEGSEVRNMLMRKVLR